MIEPGNVNSDGGPLGDFAFPILDVNSFQESAEPSPFSGGPIRHNKKRNHANTPYTRFTNPVNPNTQPTHWLKSIITKFIPDWLKEFIWPSAEVQRVATEDTSVAGSSNSGETTENIVQSSIEELHGTIVERDENHQSSQLNAVSRMSLKAKYSKLGSSRGTAVFGGRIKSSSMQKRGTIFRTKLNHISAREEDLLYPGEVKETLPSRSVSEIPSDWYKPFKDLTVNDSFLSSTSEASSSSKKETRATKKPSHKGPPPKKFKTNLVPDVHWFDYCPSEKSDVEKKSTLSSKNVTSKKQPTNATNGTTHIPKQKSSTFAALTKPVSDSEDKLSPKTSVDQAKDPSTSVAPIESAPGFGDRTAFGDQTVKSSTEFGPNSGNKLSFGTPGDGDRTKKPSTSDASTGLGPNSGSKFSFGTSSDDDRTKKPSTSDVSFGTPDNGDLTGKPPISDALAGPTSNSVSKFSFGTPGGENRTKKPPTPDASTESASDFGINQAIKPPTSDVSIEPASDSGKKFTFGTSVDQVEKSLNSVAPTKPLLNTGFNFETPNNQKKKPSTFTASTKLTSGFGSGFTFGTPGNQTKEHSASVDLTKPVFGTPVNQTKKPLTSDTSGEPVSNKLTSGAFDSGSKFTFGTSDSQTEKLPTSASTKPALNSSAFLTPDGQIKGSLTFTASTKPVFDLKNELVLTPGDQTKKSSTPTTSISGIPNFGTSSDQTHNAKTVNASSKPHFDFGTKFTELSTPSVGGSIDKTSEIVTRNEDQKVNKNEDSSETLNSGASESIETESKNNETSAELKNDESKKGDNVPESTKDEAMLESKKGEITLGLKKNETGLELKNEIALESKDGETVVGPKKDGTLDLLSKGTVLSSIASSIPKETTGDTKDKVFSSVANNSHPQNLASSPLSESPMDIDVNNVNHQVPVPSTLSFTAAPFVPSFQETLGKNFAFNNDQPFNVFNSGEMPSSTEVSSGYNSKSRMPNYKKPRNKRPFESAGNEGRNILLNPKTEGSNRMMVSESTFDFQLSSQKTDLSIIPTQPTSTGSIFKFDIPGSQGTSSGNQIGSPFQTTPISQPPNMDTFKFQNPQNNFMPQVSQSSIFTSFTGNGETPSFNASQPIFDVGSGPSGQFFPQSGTGSSRVLAKMRKRRK